jgi:hypothetical protein
MFFGTGCRILLLVIYPDGQLDSSTTIHNAYLVGTEHFSPPYCIHLIHTLFHLDPNTTTDTIQTPNHMPPTPPIPLAPDVGLAAAGPSVDDDVGNAVEIRPDRCWGEPSMLLELGIWERTRDVIELAVGVGAPVEDDVDATATGVGEEMVFGTTLGTPMKRFRRPFR